MNRPAAARPNVSSGRARTTTREIRAYTPESENGDYRRRRRDLHSGQTTRIATSRSRPRRRLNRREIRGASASTPRYSSIDLRMELPRTGWRARSTPKQTSSVEPVSGQPNDSVAPETTKPALRGLFGNLWNARSPTAEMLPNCHETATGAGGFPVKTNRYHCTFRSGR